MRAGTDASHAGIVSSGYRAGSDSNSRRLMIHPVRSRNPTSGPSADSTAAASIGGMFHRDAGLNFPSSRRSHKAPAGLSTRLAMASMQRSWTF